MSTVKERSDRSAREVYALTVTIGRLLDIGMKAPEIYMINRELVTANLALHQMEDDDFEAGEVLRYYVPKSGGDENVFANERKQLEFYLTMMGTADDLAWETAERILYILEKGRNPVSGKACPERPLNLDIFSPDGYRELTIRKQIPPLLLESIGMDGKAPDRGEEKDVKSAPDEEKDAPVPETPVSPGSGGSAAKEAPASAPAEMEKRPPMLFHNFWAYVSLPLGAIVSFINIFRAIGAFDAYGWFILLDVAIAVGWFIFGIPAMTGLWKHTYRGLLNNKRLLIYSSVVHGCMGVGYLMVLGKYGYGTALGSFMSIVLFTCIIRYYEKRKNLFCD